MNLRQRIILLTLAILIPTFGGFAWIMARNVQRAEQALRDEVLNRAHAMIVSMDQVLERREAMLTLLNRSPELQRWDLEAFCALARSAVSDDTGPVVINDRETILLNTRGHNCRPLADRRYNKAPGTFTEDRVSLSDIFTAADGTALMTLNLPIRHGDKLYNIALGIRPEVLQKAFENHKHLDGWSAAVVNGAGRVVARVPDPEKWVGRMADQYTSEPAAMRDSFSRRAPSEEGSFVGKTIDGTRINVVFSGSSRYHLTVFVAFPQSLVDARAHQTVREEAIGALLLMILCIIVAIWAGRRISGPAIALRAAADDLKEGRPVKLGPSGVPEFDLVGSALEEASETIRAHNTALSDRVAAAVAEAEASQAKLVQVQKLEVIGRLTGGIAHDFNNLLQTLSTGLSVLDQAVTDPKLRPLIEAGLRAVGRAARLVQQLLAFGRNVPFMRLPVDLHSQLLQMEILLTKTLAGNLRLKIELAPDLWHIFTDPSQLEAALLNLIFNARDAMPQGGDIVLEAHNENHEGREGVLLRVTDKGKGIPPELLEHVFEPFVTTKPVGMGAGLGLAQVRDFARASEGAVDVQSTQGKGTTVLLWLPRAKDEAVGDGVSATAEPRATAKPGGRVLFVEDDVLINEVVSSALRGAGFDVLQCPMAEEALRILRAGEHIDVVFSDIVMPGAMSGLQLAQQLRKEFPDLPVVLASGYADSLDLEQPFVVLSKPYSVQHMVSAIHEAMVSAGKPASGR